MKVFFVGAGPGDPDLLTVKARKLLENCKCCIYAGSLVSPDVIALIPPEAARYDSANLNLDEIIELITQARDEGIDVIRLHTGDPSIYGAIGEQMVRLDKLSIEYEVVPGVSSFQAAAASIKTELTAPEIAQTIILTRTSGRTPLPDEQKLSELAGAKATFCIFLSVQRIGHVARTLTAHYGKDCPIAVVYHASWPDEKIVRATLGTIEAELQGSGITKTAMILVGQALGETEAVSKLYDDKFTHEFRKASE